jgi:hypothetical protein
VWVILDGALFRADAAKLGALLATGRSVPS